MGSLYLVSYLLQVLSVRWLIISVSITMAKDDKLSHSWFTTPLTVRTSLKSWARRVVGWFEWM